MILNKLVVTLSLLLFHPHTSQAQFQYLDASNLEDNSVFAYNFAYDYSAETGELSPLFDPGKTAHTPHVTRSIQLIREVTGSEQVEQVYISGQHPVSGLALNTVISGNSLSSTSDKLSIRYYSSGRPTISSCTEIQFGSLTTHSPYKIEDLTGNSAALNSFGCTSQALNAPRSDFLRLIFQSSIFQSSVLANLSIVGPQTQSDDSRKLHLQKIHKCLLGWKHGIYNRVTLTIHPVIDNNYPTLSGANYLNCY